MKRTSRCLNSTAALLTSLHVITATVAKKPWNVHQLHAWQKEHQLYWNVYIRRNVAGIQFAQVTSAKAMQWSWQGLSFGAWHGGLRHDQGGNFPGSRPAADGTIREIQLESNTQDSSLECLVLYTQKCIEFEATQFQWVFTNCIFSAAFHPHLFKKK